MKRTKSLLLTILVISIFLSACNSSQAPVSVINNNSTPIIPITDSTLNCINKNNLYECLLLSQNQDGGFGNLPPINSRNPDLYATYYSLGSLSDLSALSSIQQKQKTVKWLNASLDDILSSPPNSGEVINNLYYVLMSLNILNQDITSTKNILGFLVKFKNQDGSYCEINNDSKIKMDEFVFSTFQVISIFNLLDQPVNLDTQNWLMQTWENRNDLLTSAINRLQYEAEVWYT